MVFEEKKRKKKKKSLFPSHLCKKVVLWPFGPG
jgi:hypothetical protein